jgi:nucleoside-triphosphatase THEP1
MINIITGKINSGKTTSLKKHYNDSQKGDGFIAKKRMKKGVVHSYDIVRLSNNDAQLLVIREDFYNGIEKVACKVGPYLFLEKSLTYVENEILKMIKNNVSPIYLDEIGQLELYDQCFNKVFNQIVQSKADCFITVKEDLVDEVIRKYKLTNVNVITI